MGIFGLSIKVKAGGAWQKAKPHVKVGGNWKPVIRAYAKVSGIWQTTYEYEYIYTFSSGEHTNVDLDTLGLDKTHNVRVIIPVQLI